MDSLRLAIKELTREQTTDKGVKYRVPKKILTFTEAGRFVLRRGSVVRTARDLAVMAHLPRSFPASSLACLYIVCGLLIFARPNLACSNGRDLLTLVL